MNVKFNDWLIASSIWADCFTENKKIKVTWWLGHKEL